MTIFKRILPWALLAAVVVAQVFTVRAWGAERVQTNVAACTIVASIWFVALYSRDPWWRTLFGRSLMLIAVALFMQSLATVLYRVVGEYPGRAFLIVGAADIALLAMVMRTRVLHVAQRDERHQAADAHPRP